MSAPDELGHGPAHRVADGDDLIEVEFIEQGDRIVGTVLELERPPGAQSVAMAPVVHGKNIEMLGQRRIGGEPVDCRIRCPAVQQQERGCTNRAG